MPESDAPPEALIREVADRYGLVPPLAARRLTGGYANDVFRLDGAGPPVVLHLKYPPADSDSLDWEHRLLAGLRSALPEALPPLAAVDDSTWFWFGSRPVWLVPWAPGGPATPTDRRAVAAVLGRLHASAAPLTARPNHRLLLQHPLPPLRPLPAALSSWDSTLSRARHELVDLVTWLAGDRRPHIGLTHNDIFEGNVLVDQGQVTAVLDWEEADLDWQVWDLASSLRPFCTTGDRLDERAVAEFVAAYRDSGGTVPPEEDELILPLVRARLILEVLRASTDRDPQWNHQLANLRAYAAASNQSPR